MNCGPLGRLGVAVAVVIAASAAMTVRPAVAQPAGEANKSSPMAIRQYRDAANFQNRELYDLAADEWEKLLAKFPQDPLIPSGQHYLGVCRFHLKQYEPAT